MSSVISIDKNLEKRAESFFSGLGLDLNTAVNIFIAQSLMRGKIPFTIGYEYALSEEEEDIRDAKIADEAYEEYVKDGCKSRPMSELFREVGIR